MQFVKLGSLVRIRTGKLDANAANEHGAYPFFTCSKTALRIDKYAYDCECVLVAGNGDLNVKYFKGKFEAYQRTYIIESLDHKRLFVKYLYHFLNVYIEKLRHMSTGGVIKFIKINNLTDAVIPLPDLDTQISLSKEFDLLSSLIDGIDSQIKKSDELIKSRFIEMFETMDLSEERDEWVELEKLSKIYTGTTPSTNDASNWDGNVLWITPAEMTKDTFYVYDTTRKITEKGRKSKSLDMMPVDTVLLSTRAPIGKVGIVGTPMACNQGFKNFKCNERINPIFLYTLLKNNTEYLNSLGSGTTFLEISKTKIGKMKIPVPEIKLQNEFANYVQLIDKSKFYERSSALCY